MSANAVDVLAHAENPKSIPTPNMMIKDCATPVCQLLIMSRLRFVGRYVLFDEIHPVHKSESCLVMRAKDHGLEDEYKRFIAIYDAKEQRVEDDISDAGSEPPDMTSANDATEVTLEMFLNFAVGLGVREEAAREEILNLLTLDNNKDDQPENPAGNSTMAHNTLSENEGDDDTYNEEMSTEIKKQDPDDENGVIVGKEAFTTFCRAHRLNEKGVRTVVIKFMKNVRQFKHEIEVRGALDLSGPTWPVVPILDHYNVDRIEASRRRDIDIMSLRDEMAEDAISGAPENRDELYALDIQEKNASVHNFALYKYAVVLPAGDRDLGEISQHEELGILQIREYMLQVGTALKCLHSEGMLLLLFLVLLSYLLSNI
jgi:serine/threonine protein kinase